MAAIATSRVVFATPNARSGHLRKPASARGMSVRTAVKKSADDSSSVFKYISEGVQQIASPMHNADEPTWAVSPFDGTLHHHEDSGMRAHYEPVGAMPPEPEAGEEAASSSALHDAVVDAIEHAIATDSQHGGASLKGGMLRHRRDIRNRHNHH